jgi:argininosuccinate lyase
MAAPLVAGMELNRTAIASGLERGYLDATTFMEWLIRRGTPQRTAHHLVGQLVRRAMDRGVPLSGLPLEVFQELHPGLDDEVYGNLGVKQAVAAFTSYGSTAPAEVAEQVVRWRNKLAMEDSVEQSP